LWIGTFAIIFAPKVITIYKDASGLLAQRVSDSKASASDIGSRTQVGRTIKDLAQVPIRLMDRVTLRTYVSILEKELIVARATLATLDANEGVLALGTAGSAANHMPNRNNSFTSGGGTTAASVNGNGNGNNGFSSLATPTNASRNATPNNGNGGRAYATTTTGSPRAAGREISSGRPAGTTTSYNKYIAPATSVSGVRSSTPKASTSPPSSGMTGTQMAVITTHASSRATVSTGLVECKVPASPSSRSVMDSSASPLATCGGIGEPPCMPNDVAPMSIHTTNHNNNNSGFGNGINEASRLGQPPSPASMSRINTFPSTTAAPLAPPSNQGSSSVAPSPLPPSSSGSGRLSSGETRFRHIGMVTATTTNASGGSSGAGIVVSRPTPTIPGGNNGTQSNSSGIGDENTSLLPNVLPSS
jgi:hypothetical protein